MSDDGGGYHVVVEAVTAGAMSSCARRRRSSVGAAQPSSTRESTPPRATPASLIDGTTGPSSEMLAGYDRLLLGGVVGRFAAPNRLVGSPDGHGRWRWHIAGHPEPCSDGPWNEAPLRTVRSAQLTPVELGAQLGRSRLP
ncbi:MAG: hypothetical protein R2749_15970 [Acidimicrobiales bacterium]